MKNILSTALVICASTLIVVTASESTEAREINYDLYSELKKSAIPGLFPAPRVGRRSMWPALDFSTVCELASDRVQICCDPKGFMSLAKSGQLANAQSWVSPHVSIRPLDNDPLKM